MMQSHHIYFHTPCEYSYCMLHTVWHAEQCGAVQCGEVQYSRAYSFTGLLAVQMSLCSSVSTFRKST